MTAGLLAATRTRRLGLDSTPSKRRLDCSTRGRIHSSAQRTKLAANTVNMAWMRMPAGTATHQMLDFERRFLLLVARLDGLAGVVIVKPLRQIESDAGGSSWLRINTACSTPFGV